MAEGIPKNMIKRILCVMLAVILLGFGTDMARLLYLQVINDDEYAQKAETQQLSDTEVSAMRGTIYDSDMNVLAQSATAYNVFIDPGSITSEEKRQTLVDGLSSIFKYTDKKKEELTKSAKQKTRYVVIEKKVDNDTKDKINAFCKKNSLSSSVGFEQTTKRYYPYNSFASSVLGFTGSDDQGLSGLESFYNDTLTGTNGRIITAKDAVSNKLPGDYATSVEAKDGNSLVLTINQTIQYYLEKGMSEALEQYQCKGVYGVMMNVKTGAVLAMSSMPDYNCNSPYKITYSKTKKEIKSITNKKQKSVAESSAVQNQWRNFCVSDVYVPGSVFKPFTASAALEENVVNMNTTFTCTGRIQVDDRTMNCWYHSGHGTQTLTQGLANSCNPFFITIGQKLGAERFFKYFESFGFTEKTGIDLPGETDSIYVNKGDYTKVSLSSAAFGQTNSMTPIQICSAMCAVANGGTLVKPYIVSEIVDADGNTVSKTKTTKVRQVISKDTSEKVRSMMEAVVDGGTGKNAYVAGYSVGGKTGTSTKLGESKAGEKDKYLASFIGIAPSDNPEIALLIILDEPNIDLGGGALAAPIASGVIEQAMSELNIQPEYSEDEIKELSNTTPSLIGKSLDDAKASLKSENLSYKVVGNGSKVIKQSPSSGKMIPSDGTVVIYTDNSSSKKVEVPDFTGLTISEVNSLAAAKNLNVRLSGSELTSSSVIACRQSEKSGSKVDIGTVVTVTFKNNTAVND